MEIVEVNGITSPIKWQVSDCGISAVLAMEIVQYYGIPIPLAIETPQSYIGPFNKKKCKILAYHGFVTRFQLRAHKLFVK